MMDTFRDVRHRITLLDDEPQYVVYAWDTAGDGIKVGGTGDPITTPKEALIHAAQMARDFPDRKIVVYRIMATVRPESGPGYVERG